MFYIIQLDWIKKFPVIDTYECGFTSTNTCLVERIGQFVDEKFHIKTNDSE